MKSLPKKLLPLTLFAAITVAALVLSRPAFAVNILPSHDINIIENSSTSLTLRYDGSDITASAVMNTASDRWTLTFAPTIQFTTFTLNGWQEPGQPQFVVNILDSPGTNQLFVFSDTQGGNDFPDGTTFAEFGFESGVETTFNITFHDLGDAAGVPDGGTTVSLLGLGLLGLAALRRKLSC